MSLNFCAIVASFLAYGILRLNGFAGKAGWRSVTPIHYYKSDLFIHLNSQVVVLDRVSGAIGL